MSVSTLLCVVLSLGVNAAIVRQDEKFLYKELHMHQVEFPSPPSGFTIGTGLGSLAGVVAGATLGHKDGMTGAGALGGGVCGGLSGAIIGWWWDSVKHVTNRPEITTVRLPQPAIEKMEKQAEMAAALSDYEEKQARGVGDETEANQEAREEHKALKALGDISENVEERKKTGRKVPMAQNRRDIEDVQDVIAEGDTAEMVSAESAMANNAAVTANDLARIAGGSKKNAIRGEDLGAAGSKKAYQGDMIPVNKTQMALFQAIASGGMSSGRKQWPNFKAPGQIAAGAPWKDGKVNYCFASDVSAGIKQIFKAATRQIHRAVPCISFADVGWKAGTSMSEESDQLCQKSPAIFVQSNPNEGCYSYVGFADGYDSQRYQLQNPGCLSVGTAVHELGHALGMAHEQARPDRDKHVKIHWQNIKSGMESNFDKNSNAYTKEQYDLNSIMHYDRFAFTTDWSKPTIEFLGRDAHEGLGQRSGLSQYDVSQLAAMYKCTGTALAGMGCVNKVNAQGADICSGIKQCDQQGIKHCCACGGGVAVQCYKGKPCPNSPKLSGLNPSDCIGESTSLFPGANVPCIYSNDCSFPIEFTCSGGCQNKASPQTFEATKCNGKYVTDVCMDRDKCKFKAL